MLVAEKASSNSFLLPSGSLTAQLTRILNAEINRTTHLSEGGVDDGLIADEIHVVFANQNFSRGLTGGSHVRAALDDADAFVSLQPENTHYYRPATSPV